VILQPGVELDLKTDLDFSRQPLAQNSLLSAVTEYILFSLLILGSMGQVGFFVQL
jgi:hypothetical protein